MSPNPPDAWGETRGTWDARYLGLLCGGLVLYGGYVAWGTGTPVAPLPVLLAAAGTVGLSRGSPATSRRWMSASFLLLAALHLSLLGAAAPALPVQLAASAAVMCSALTSLGVELLGRRPRDLMARSFLVAIAIVGLVLARAPYVSGAVTAFVMAGAGLAWLRPLGAIGIARPIDYAGPTDPGLWWSPLPQSKESHGPLR